MNNIAILIPHYNNPKGLVKSLESIYNTEKVDVFIIDDGSVINKINEIEVKSFFKALGEVHFHYLNKNQGIENALNQGIKLILSKQQYKYIARLDCGDLCVGKRFELQEKYMESNPGVKLLGSNAIAVDTNYNFLYNTFFPEKHKIIQNKMYLNAMFLHPTIMFSIDIIPKIGLYPTNYEAAEDYAYFFKIVKNFETANIQEFLIKYEITHDGISISKRKIQVKSRLRIIMKHFYFGFWPIYGLIRNLLLYTIPYAIILKIKKIKK